MITMPCIRKAVNTWGLFQKAINTWGLFGKGAQYFACEERGARLTLTSSEFHLALPLIINTCTLTRMSSSLGTLLDRKMSSSLGTLLDRKIADELRLKAIKDARVVRPSADRARPWRAPQDGPSKFFHRRLFVKICQNRPEVTARMGATLGQQQNLRMILTTAWCGSKVFCFDWQREGDMVYPHPKSNCVALCECSREVRQLDCVQARHRRIPSTPAGHTRSSWTVPQVSHTKGSFDSPLFWNNNKLGRW
jgi:hypothetical protein